MFINRTILIILGIIFCIGLPLPFLLNHISQVPILDAVFIYYAALTTADEGIPKTPDGGIGAWHIPTYLYLSSIFIKIFGSNIETVRIVGIILFYLTALVTALTVSGLSPPGASKLWPWFATIVYLTYPIAVQGALLPDFDTTLVPLATISFVGYFAIKGPPRRLKSWLILATLFAFTFFAKETHPPILFLGAILYLFILRASIREFIVTISALAVGLIGAFLMYVIFSYLVNWPFESPFTHGSIHLKEYIRDLLSSERLFWRVRFLAGFISWFMLPLCVIALGILIGSLRRTFSPKDNRKIDGLDLLVTVSTLYFLIVTFVCGFSWWFPRYYSGMVPIFIATIMSWSSRNVQLNKIRYHKIILIIAIIAVIQIMLIGDPIKTFIYDAKLSSLENLNSNFVILKFISQAAATFILLPLVLLILKLLVKGLQYRSIVALSCPILSIGLGIGLLILQSQYEQTTYGYSSQGTKECIDKLNQAIHPGEFVIAPFELALFTKSEKVFVFEPDWNNTEKLYRNWALNPMCRAIVMSLSRNSIEQFNRVKKHEELSEYLRNHFQFNKIGDYWVWIKPTN